MIQGRISPLQFALLIVSAYIGAGIFEYPRDIIVAAGDNAAYAFLLEGAIALGGMWLLLQVNHLDPDHTVGEISRKIGTAGLAWPLGFVTVAVHLALFVYAIANFCLVMRTFFLDLTPVWGLASALVLVAGFLAWNDTAPLARALQIIVAPTLIVSLLMGMLVTPQLHDLYAAVPGSSIQLGSIATGVWRGWYIFWGYEVTVTLYPFVRQGDRRRAERYTYVAMLLSMGFFAIGYVLTVGTEGPYLLMHSLWPAVSTMRLINVTSFLVNKLGLFIIVLWGLIVTAFASVRLWCLGHDILPFLPSQTVGAYRWVVVLCALAGFGWVMTFQNATQLNAFAEGTMMPAMWAYNFVTPVLLLGIAKVRAMLSGRAVPRTA